MLFALVYLIREYTCVYAGYKPSTELQHLLGVGHTIERGTNICQPLFVKLLRWTTSKIIIFSIVTETFVTKILFVCVPPEQKCVVNPVSYR